MRSRLLELPRQTFLSIAELISPLRHKNGHNGNGAEKNGHIAEVPKPQYQILFESTLAALTPEDIVELNQGRALEIALERHPYHAEDGEDQVREGRRLSALDTYSYFKRSDLEVKRYKLVLEKILQHPQKDQILQELILRWTTTTNLLEIASLISFSVEEVEAFEQELQSSSYTAPTNNTESAIDPSASWYKLLLEAFAEDNIVPIVLIRDLVLDAHEKPSLQLLAIGLQNYLQRGFVADLRRNDPLEAKLARLNMKKQLAERLKKIAQSRS